MSMTLDWRRVKPGCHDGTSPCGYGGATVTRGGFLGYLARVTYRGKTADNLAKYDTAKDAKAWCGRALAELHSAWFRSMYANDCAKLRAWAERDGADHGNAIGAASGDARREARFNLRAHATHGLRCVTLYAPPEWRGAYVDGYEDAFRVAIAESTRVAHAARAFVAQG